MLGCIQSHFTSEKWYISGSKLSVFGTATSLLSAI